jgi:uncharacterized protein
MTRNRLDQETSPYLLQHQDNPVHWQPWGPKALDLARQAERPILLSIGYAACHWCHVMAHESFEDHACAEVMNSLFVNIKVDREERPDIDAIYQSALALLGQQGGWPLTMFLTPDGQPFWGGTYFPNPARYGRPAFPEVLRRVDEVYRTDPQTITQNQTELTTALDKMAASATPGTLTPADLDPLALRVLNDMDTVHGGTRGAPKFPRPFMFEFLWRAYRRTGNPRYKDAVTLSLDNISQGGIYDHLGGGFARYSTDELWLAPHFEKMLYDNGSLIDVLRLVWQETRSPLYEARIRESIGWLLREMVAEGGGFAASLDADSEGAEGVFYVWSEVDIDRLLGAEASHFKDVYDVSASGNWEGTNILNRLAHLPLGDPGNEARLTACRATLLDHRRGRERPGWDDKVLADWNGLAIRALALAGRTFDEDTWITAAQHAFQFIVENMTLIAEAPRLHHSYRAGRASHAAVLDDYVNMIGAALGLHEVTDDPHYLSQAEAWITVLDAHYRDLMNGAYFFTADDAEALITRTRTAIDNATPSGNGAIVGWLARLYHLTGNTRYRTRAEEIVGAFAGDADRHFHSLQTLLNGFEDLANPIQVVIIGDRSETLAAALLNVTHDTSLPNLALSVVTPAATLPPGHPAAGKTQSDGIATAYVCVGTTCSLPLTTPDALRAQLRATAAEAA